MIEDFLRFERTAERLRTGPLAQYIDDYATWLDESGYSHLSIDFGLRCLASFSDWASGQVFSLALWPALVEAHREHLLSNGQLRYQNNSEHNSRKAVRLFEKFLRHAGHLEVPEPPVLPPLVVEFNRWMLVNRGVRNSSLGVYNPHICAMLERLGSEPALYDAESIRTFVLARGGEHGLSRAKSLANAIRAFLRFLGSTGRGPAGLEHAVPRYAAWRNASMPRFIEPDQLERVIASCDPTTPSGARDHAVILLLTRLGLRASDVAQMKLSDIDWNEARLLVGGKSRRHDWLPLSQEVGEALLHYLSTSRPNVLHERLFFALRAPIRPLSRAAVTHIAKAAILRAGVTAPSLGAHLLRHSAATALLRQGVSLQGVGAILRHTSPGMTAHYAKVDFGMLGEIAQPWPGGE